MHGRERKICVSYDFGSTFSGGAYGYTEKPRDIHTISTWLGGSNLTTDKVPTEFSYGTPSTPIRPLRDGEYANLSTFLGIYVGDDGLRKEIRWGYQLLPHELRIKCIKLFLAPDQEIPSFVSNAENIGQLILGGRTVEAAIADYLAALHKHTMMVLNKRYGKALLDATKLEFVITVPANWTEKAKSITISAANHAGIHKPGLITEPEAAACYTLSNEEGDLVEDGTHIVVCDAGGGTVDLISYKITSTKPLSLEESTVGVAGLCGSNFLNVAFANHVKNLMGEAAYNDLLFKKPRAMQVAMQEFDTHVKRTFTSSATDNYSVPINGAPDNEDIGIMDSMLSLTPSQVQAIMDPTVEQVLKLIDGQVQQIVLNGDTVAKVLLVGGFGQSAYLLERAQARYACIKLEDTKPSLKRKREDSEPLQDSIEILQPPHAWTAVLRGAVLRGLEGDIIKGRKSRYNYGVRANVPWDPKIHSGSKYWDRHEGRYYTRNIMEWALKKGETIKPNSTYTMDFTETWGGKRFPYARDMIPKVEIYCNPASIAPQYFRDGLMRLVCVLEVDLHTVPRTYFENQERTEASGGKKFHWVLEYQLEMTFVDNELRFEVKVDEASYGFAKANFEAEE